MLKGLIKKLAGESWETMYLFPELGLQFQTNKKEENRVLCGKPTVEKEEFSAMADWITTAIRLWTTKSDFFYSHLLEFAQRRDAVLRQKAVSDETTVDLDLDERDEEPDDPLYNLSPTIVEKITPIVYEEPQKPYVLICDDPVITKPKINHGAIAEILGADTTSEPNPKTQMYMGMVSSGSTYQPPQEDSKTESGTADFDSPGSGGDYGSSTDTGSSYSSDSGSSYSSDSGSSSFSSD